MLTALGERDALVRDAEQRAGQILRTMTKDESLSLREAADWCGSGVTVREITRLLRSAAASRAAETAASDERQAGAGTVPGIAVGPIAARPSRPWDPPCRPDRSMSGCAAPTATGMSAASAASSTLHVLITT